MMKSGQYIGHILAVMAASMFAVGCEKEDVLGPDRSAPLPTHASVTLDKDLILSEGRDSSSWQIQLERKIGGDTVAFNGVYTVNMETDRHGYFISQGKKQRKIVLDTDAGGRASVVFYGSREPGISSTLVWGEGFGPNIVTVIVVTDYPHYILLKFKDLVTGTEMDTDTLRSGRPRFSRHDSSGLQVTILDRDQQPLEGVTVSLSNGSPPIGSGAYGYFASLGAPPQGISYGSIVTDDTGVASDIYYSDVAPAIGFQDLDIVATVETARFGSISLTKTLTIIPP